MGTRSVAIRIAGRCRGRKASRRTADLSGVGDAVAAAAFVHLGRRTIAASALVPGAAAMRRGTGIVTSGGRSFEMNT